MSATTIGRIGGLLLAMVAVARAASAAPSAPANPQVLGPPQGMVINLWPEGVPLAQPNAPAEHVEDGRVYNVNVPTLTLFTPPPGTANGTAAIVCPGGGYARLAVDKEGSELQRWLNGLGVTVFILKYRVAPYQHPAPLLDVLRAVRIVRSRATELHVDPARIGVFGSSAGGHLAASAATLYNSPEGRSNASLDKVSGRPDFIVLTYPVITMRPPIAHGGSRTNLIGAHPSADLMNRLSLELHVSSETPPAFIVHTQEDQSVPVENSLAFYQALRGANVPVEMHLYEKGPHGFGMHPGLGPTSEWPKRCEEWMRSHGWLAPTTSATASATATGTIGK